MIVKTDGLNDDSVEVAATHGAQNRLTRGERHSRLRPKKLELYRPLHPLHTQHSCPQKPLPKNYKILIIIK